jgi:hypothetical protein
MLSRVSADLAKYPVHTSTLKDYQFTSQMTSLPEDDDTLNASDTDSPTEPAPTSFSKPQQSVIGSGSPTTSRQLSSHIGRSPD